MMTKVLILSVFLNTFCADLDEKVLPSRQEVKVVLQEFLESKKKLVLTALE